MVMEASCDPILPWIKPGWIGCEIGVAQGDSALRFLENGVRFMYLVDPWADYDGLLDKYTPGSYEEAMRKLSPYASKHAHLRMTSAEAARYIPPILDFCWLDGNHRYEWVKSDLELYWPLIKSGGIMCGHDYTDNADTCQVMTAVNEFWAKQGLAGIATPLPCWILRKP